MLELNQFYNIDCMEGMKQIPDRYFDLAIVDPPYGIGENAFRTKSRTKLARTTDYGSFDKDWDKECPSEDYFNELFRVSKHQIIWGANHMMHRIKKGSPCWIVWDKDNTGCFADCELAYASFSFAVRKFTYRWNGMIQQDMKNKESRIHPTQKPVALYKWLLSNYAMKGWRILDTHVGSASSLIACHEMGFQYMGFEINSDYYAAAQSRLEDQKAQINLFRELECVR
jgi:site-specific DNA-methyltransferase (adenine-specific)